jgi:S-adenosylmethionine-diacylglycerol 3-amino-3-carboxypropyl transferase
MPLPVIDELWTEISKVGAPGTRVIFRTAGEASPIEKALSPATMARFRSHAAEARALSAQDRSAIYGMFHLYELAEPASS